MAKLITDHVAFFSLLGLILFIILVGAIIYILLTLKNPIV